MNELHDLIYLAVGKAILDFSHLELVIHRVAWTGIDPADDKAGRGQTEKRQVGRILMQIEELAKAGKYGEETDRVRAFVRDCRDVAEMRGRLAHSYLDHGRIGRTRDAIRNRLPLLASTESTDLDAIQGLPDRIYALRDEGTAIWQATMP